MKKIHRFLVRIRISNLIKLQGVLFILLFLFASDVIAQQGLMYVGYVGDNADIYFMPDVNNPSFTRRLTTNAAIDNHPDYVIMGSDTAVVWSSNRNGNFDLWYGTLPDLEATAVLITPGNDYSDRHPHFSHDGTRIVYTAKYRFEPSVVCPKSECSVPVNTPCGWYEGLRVMTVGTWAISDIDLRNMTITGGGTWPNTFETWVGHPSFSHDGTKILFCAALDGGGTDWEIYWMNFSPPGSVSNLTKVTNGTVYPENSNPIKMSAGAHFTNNDSKIIYSSTRTPLGNSQLFTISASSVSAPVHPVNQLTWNNGNDYVPEELDDGRIVFTSDLGPGNICNPLDTIPSATDDLDINIMNADGSGRGNVTNNNAADEMQLIGDEVSWFCGLKPNLSPCTFYLKAWNICWWKEFFMLGTMPTYEPLFPHRLLYTRAFLMVHDYMSQHDPVYFQQILSAMNQYWTPCETSWMQVQSWWVIQSIFNQQWDLNLPAPPSLTAPVNMSVLFPVSNFTFDWTDVPGATSYGIQIDTNPSFTNPIFQDSSLTQSQFSASLPLGTYYWRTSASNSSGKTWSTVWFVIINDNGTPTLSQWGLIILAILFLGFGIFYINRKIV